MRPVTVVTIAGGAHRLGSPLDAVPERSRFSFQICHSELVEQCGADDRIVRQVSEARPRCDGVDALGDAGVQSLQPGAQEASAEKRRLLSTWNLASEKAQEPWARRGRLG